VIITTGPSVGKLPVLESNVPSFAENPCKAALLEILCAKLSDVPVFDPYSTYKGTFASSTGRLGWTDPAVTCFSFWRFEDGDAYKLGPRLRRRARI